MLCPLQLQTTHPSYYLHRVDNKYVTVPADAFHDPLSPQHFKRIPSVVQDEVRMQPKAGTKRKPHACSNRVQTHTFERVNTVITGTKLMAQECSKTTSATAPILCTFVIGIIASTPARPVPALTKHGRNCQLVAIVMLGLSLIESVSRANALCEDAAWSISLQGLLYGG